MLLEYFVDGINNAPLDFKQLQTEDYISSYVDAWHPVQCLARK